MRVNVNTTTVSVIVTTYNWPSALSKVLQALMTQDYNNFEIIIADDGSSESTYEVIKNIQSNGVVAIAHVWQEDDGFRAAKIRNKAVAKAKGDYLIFIDGDCVPQKSFVKRHIQLAEKQWLVSGNRVLLSQEFTQQILKTNANMHEWNFIDWLSLRCKQNCNRILPLIKLPFFPRKLNPLRWTGVKTCNLGLWKNDFLEINGFDEEYKGWGYEDSDLVVRLIQKGVKVKNGRFAIPVIHLWHNESDRSTENINLARLQSRIRNHEISAQIGINQYLEEGQ